MTAAEEAVEIMMTGFSSFQQAKLEAKVDLPCKHSPHLNSFAAENETYLVNGHDFS